MPRSLSKRHRTPAPDDRGLLVNKPDGQPSTVRPERSFSLDARAFLSEVEPPPLSSLLFQRAKKYIENQDAPEI
ncbi:MAG TPA: hypothetical protein V6D37_02715 [Candidatus Sericytochromatia bacterium]